MTLRVDSDLQKNLDALRIEGSDLEKYLMPANEVDRKRQTELEKFVEWLAAELMQVKFVRCAENQQGWLDQAREVLGIEEVQDDFAR